MAIVDFGIAALLFGAFGLILCHLARDIIGWPRQLCVAILSSAMGCSAADMLLRAAQRYQAPIPAYRALLVIESLVSPLPTLLMLAYILYLCEEDYRKSRLLRVLCVLSGLLAVCLSVIDVVGEISPAPDYALQIGLWPVLFLFLSAALMSVTLIALFRRWKKLTMAQRIMFFLSFFSSRSSVILFVEFLFVYDLIRRYLAQQKESERQRTGMAVAQMRPHFIYNVLLSVYYLCATDAEKAQQVILDFNQYLQGNFTAIAEEKPILFDKELEHTKAYLAVEQACHEGSLFVAFDTPHTLFHIPALTLQPIVENAVKYGVVPGLPPLYIFVSTEDTGSGIQITVEDTGPGFQQPVDNGPHIALNNIRQRLGAMCGGTLSIEPREEGGTKVTMFVPRRSS